MNEKLEKRIRRLAERMTVGRSKTQTRTVTRRLKKIYRQYDANADERADNYLRNWGSWVRAQKSPLPAGYEPSPMFKDYVAGYREEVHVNETPRVDEAEGINEIILLAINEPEYLMPVHIYYAGNDAERHSVRMAAQRYNSLSGEDVSATVFAQRLKIARGKVGACFEMLAQA